MSKVKIIRTAQNTDKEVAKLNKEMKAVLIMHALVSIVIVAFIFIWRSFEIKGNIIYGVIGGGSGAIIAGLFFETFSYFIKRKELIKSRIVFAPGATISKIIAFFFTKKFKERVFDSIFADVHFEYFDALDKGFKWKARWIHFRGVLTIFLKVFSLLPTSLLSIIVKSIKIG